MTQQDFGAMRLAISNHAFVDETAHMQTLLASLAHVQPMDKAIYDRAAGWVKNLREQGAGNGVEAFLHEYGLDTKEGVAIMCLAEALLRIPDAHTADQLIQGTFEHTEWSKHLGGSDSLFVNASSWGLLLTGKVVNLGQDKPANVLAKLVSKFGDPVIREALKKAMRFIGGQFVLGETIDDALARAASHAKKGYRFSFDILGEGARSDEQAQAYVRAYHHAIGRIQAQVKSDSLYAAHSISVKLSALHPRYQWAQSDRVIGELLPRLKGIVQLAQKAGITVSLDAEEATRLDIELQLFETLLHDKDLAGFDGIGFVVQAYQKRAPFVIDFLAALARHTKRRIPLRLVKGAYWDSEIKWAQAQGLPGYPVFTRKEHTDVSYLACMDKMLANIDCFYPQFATHNARTIATIAALAAHHGVQPGQYELQRLHGMGEKLHDLVVTSTPSRIYAPVGAHKDLLAYLIRRLLENGANTSFVNLLMDKERPLNEVIANPIAMAESHGASPNPSIPLPESLYPDRKNSRGVDFGNLAACNALQDGMRPHLAAPLAAVTAMSVPEMENLVVRAKNAQSAWAARSVDERAGLLEKVADSIEAGRDALMAILSKEAGKTLPDGLAEIREAADFCRYYATHARALMAPDTLTGPTGESNVLTTHPRGTFLCISPWNFPLAIFTGQVAAALATGNCVIAKPAEQTPRIALAAVALMHQAGIPNEVAQLVIGSGRVVGQTLVAHKDIDGVVFTGSMDTAQVINRTLAAKPGPIAPLIAETGGQNCMAVDSSALLEQAVDDIILSAFGSAGQRCSALRVLFVQDDIADELLHLLAGAMQELSIGNAAEFSTDVGPVIDAKAQEGLLAHIEDMKKSAKYVAHVPGNYAGAVVPPHAFEIPSIAMLTKENFGPVLHVVRFKGGALHEVIDAVNSTGYGLTFGVHSRIEEHVELLVSQVRAGNFYVNRSMIGAVVGVQPFGGEGLSGTGPKAGGPHYLTRFVTERTTTINTAAIGGNLALLSQ